MSSAVGLAKRGGGLADGGKVLIMRVEGKELKARRTIQGMGEMAGITLILFGQCPHPHNRCRNRRVGLSQPRSNDRIKPHLLH